MNIEMSTVNVLLGVIVILQTWMIREIVGFKIKVAVILAHCKRCKANNELDTDRLTKNA